MIAGMSEPPTWDYHRLHLSYLINSKYAVQISYYIQAIIIVFHKPTQS